MPAPWSPSTPCRVFSLTRPLAAPRFSLPPSLFLSPQQSVYRQTPIYQTIQWKARYASSNSRWKQRQGSDPFARTARVQGLKSRAAFKLLEMDARHHLFKPNQTVVDLGFAPGSWSQVALERTKPGGRVVGIDIIPAQPPRGVSTVQGNFLSEGVREMVKRILVQGRDHQREKRGAGERRQEEDVGEGDGVVVERASYIDLERMDSGRMGETEGPRRSGEGIEDGNVRLVDVVLSDMSAPWPQTHGFSINSLSNPYRRMMNTSGIAFKDHAGSMDLCMAALTFASDTLKPGGHFVCKFYQGAEDKTFENLLKKMFGRVHREKPESSRSESREAFFVALKRKGDVILKDIQSG